MVKRREIYYCEICGNIVEVEVGGKGALVCCGENMKLLTAKTADTSKEKHVPYIQKEKGGFRVKVGKKRIIRCWTSITSPTSRSALTASS